MKRRATYLGVPEVYNLNASCIIINQAFDSFGCYLVGSSLETKEYRDVDIRMILADDEYARLFPGPVDSLYNGRLMLMNAAVSEWLKARTGLPIDFQFQQQTDANANHRGQRNAMGLTFLESKSKTDFKLDSTGESK
jgi:hypothetical protein